MPAPDGPPRSRFSVTLPAADVSVTAPVVTRCSAVDVARRVERDRCRAGVDHRAVPAAHRRRRPGVHRDAAGARASGAPAPSLVTMSLLTAIAIAGARASRPPPAAPPRPSIGSRTSIVSVAVEVGVARRSARRSRSPSRWPRPRPGTPDRAAADRPCPAGAADVDRPGERERRACPTPRRTRRRRRPRRRAPRAHRRTASRRPTTPRSCRRCRASAHRRSRVAPASITVRDDRGTPPPPCTPPPTSAMPPPASPATSIRLPASSTTSAPSTFTLPPLAPLARPDASSVPATRTTPSSPPCRTISPARCAKLVARTTPLVLITLSSTAFAAEAAIRMLPPSASIVPVWFTYALQRPAVHVGEPRGDLVVDRERDQLVAEEIEREAVPGGEHDAAELGADHAGVLDAGRDQRDEAARVRGDLAAVDDDRVAVHHLVELVAAGHEVLVRDVGGRGDEPADVDLRAGSDQDAVRVDEEHRAVRGEPPEDR